MKDEARARREPARARLRPGLAGDVARGARAGARRARGRADPRPRGKEPRHRRAASNLRKWAAYHLGLGKPAAPGGGRDEPRRASPPRSAGSEADAPFRQRLLFERLDGAPRPARVAPRPQAPGLPPPRPRRSASRASRCAARARADLALFGPFRDRRAAERAREALHRLFPPAALRLRVRARPALPLGLGCLYAQVRSCAAPCLAPVSEEDYRALAARAAAWLAVPRRASEAPPAVPAIVAAPEGACAVVVDAGRERGGPLPGRGGDACSRHGGGRASPPGDARGGGRRPRLARAGRRADDWPWLAAWLRSPKGARLVRPRGRRAPRRSPPRSARRCPRASPPPRRVVT